MYWLKKENSAGYKLTITKHLYFEADASSLLTTFFIDINFYKLHVSQMLKI